MTKKEKGFRSFIKENFSNIILVADVGSSWRIEYIFYTNDQHNNDGSETEYTINIIPENKEITLLVFDRIRKYYYSNQLDKIIDGLCHEVGHVVLVSMDELISQPYKTEQEAGKISETMATKIGHYLYDLTHGDKNKWYKRKVRQNKSIKQKPHKKQ